MITLLSPAKKLLDVIRPYSGFTSRPLFQNKTAELVALMQAKSCEDIARLMDLSPALADLNYRRYQNFLRKEEVDYPALFFFQGDVYKGLEAASWDSVAVDFAQKHLMILSGLYGLLRPLDRIHAYRLEMGTALANSYGKSLYDFWKQDLVVELNNRLETEDNPVLINLASIEYFKSVNMKMLKFPVVNIHFKEEKNAQLKVIGIYSKLARGTMARYLMQNQFDQLGAIKEFRGLNYRFSVAASDKENFVFTRIV